MRMKKVRWEEIMTVAARLFCEKGYMATTMDDIAAELYITKPALYYYIRTKHDLLYEICEVAIKRLMEGVESIEASGGPPEERFRELVRWQINMFSEHGDIINVYLADESELPTEKREYIRGLSREYESIYRELLRELIDEGTFREMNIPMAVRAISGMCNWLSNWYRPEGKMTADAIAGIFLDLIFNGFRSDAAMPGVGTRVKSGRVAKTTSRPEAVTAQAADRKH
jgi:AcrR family transcriptional regulator